MDAKLLAAATRYAKHLMRRGFTYDQAVIVAGNVVRNAQRPQTLTEQLQARGFVR